MNFGPGATEDYKAVFDIQITIQAHDLDGTPYSFQDSVG